MELTDRDIRERAKSMRRAMTRSESRIWKWLRNRALWNEKFRRQHPIGRHIVDFYCPELKLAIELDGSHHSSFDMNRHDALRTPELQTYGIFVVRITNEQLAKDSATALQVIQWAIDLRRSGSKDRDRG